MGKWMRILKPSTSRRGLFLFAGVVWTIASFMLLSRGIVGLLLEGKNITLDMVIGFSCGVIFYIYLFSVISSKHLKRISEIKIERPCMFSFFNLKSYVMMIIMISGGVTLRLLDIINRQVLFTFYLTMGLPLLISAFRFYWTWWRFESINN